MAKLEVGEVAPDFTLRTAGGGEISLAEELERAEKGAIVYFYPKAMTPGCTTEACDFRDSFARFTGWRVVGVSPDPVERLDRFAEKYTLPFTLASDPAHEVLAAWGAWGEKKNYGRVYEGVIRSTVVVGKDSRVLLAQYNVKATGHVARLYDRVASW